MDDYSPLCEDCGYDLAGLHASGSCPECGRAIARSLPAARTGSAWQQRPGFFAWVRTFWRVLRHPTEEFARTRIDLRVKGLLAVNLIIGATLAAAPWAGVTTIERALRVGFFDVEPSFMGPVLVGLLVTVEVGLVAFVLLALTWVECLGIRFFTRRRGWRLTRAGAWQVCAHASFGWIFCGTLAMLFLAAMFSILRLYGVAPGGTLDLAPTLPIRLDWYQVIGVGGPALAYFVGLIIFETLVYKGVNACKFAATIKPE